MAWPTLAHYNAAFSNPTMGLLATSLAGAKPKPGPNGPPMPLSGGFAYIYEVSLPDGSRKAVRCFNGDEPGRRARARTACLKLAATLRDNPSLACYFVPTLWEDSGILAGGTRVPAVVMDWVEGQTLGQYVEAHSSDKAALGRLRQGLADLVAKLERHGLVHGDLQTGNIIITARDEVRLLDYDGLSFVGFNSGPELEAGHVHFQHPAWGPASPFERKDRFPSIAIDLGLAALIERPELFRQYSTGENILFVNTDYADPDGSPVFEALSHMPDLARAGELFAGLCRSPIELLPSLADFRAEAFRAGASTADSAPAPEAAARATPPAPATARPQAKARKVQGPYVGPYQVFAGVDFPGILKAVGRKVEVVGKVVSVKEDGRTKYGLPYVFVNFGDWRQSGFKLTIWSEGLDTFDEAPDSSWEGRWVSAIGLIDEPYSPPGAHKVQLSITIQDSSQVRLITAKEAAWRLGKGEALQTAPMPERAGLGTNADLLGNLERPGTRPAQTAGPGGPRPKTNAELLAQLTAPPARQPANTNRPSPPSTWSPAPVPAKPERDKSGCFTVIAWIVGLFLVYAFISSR